MREWESRRAGLGRECVSPQTWSGAGGPLSGWVDAWEPEMPPLCPSKSRAWGRPAETQFPTSTRSPCPLPRRATCAPGRWLADPGPELWAHPCGKRRPALSEGRELRASPSPSQSVPECTKLSDTRSPAPAPLGLPSRPASPSPESRVPMRPAHPRPQLQLVCALWAG